MLGAEEISQQLRTAFLQRDPSFVPKTQARWLTTAHASTLGYLTHASDIWGPFFHLHVHIPPQGHIQIYIYTSASYRDEDNTNLDA